MAYATASSPRAASRRAARRRRGSAYDQLCFKTSPLFGQPLFWMFYGVRHRLVPSSGIQESDETQSSVGVWPTFLSHFIYIFFLHAENFFFSRLLFWMIYGVRHRLVPSSGIQESDETQSSVGVRPTFFSLFLYISFFLRAENFLFGRLLFWMFHGVRHRLVPSSGIQASNETQASGGVWRLFFFFLFSIFLLFLQQDPPRPPLLQMFRGVRHRLVPSSGI
jgi:hypothetical protein